MAGRARAGRAGGSLVCPQYIAGVPRGYAATHRRATPPAATDADQGKWESVSARAPTAPPPLPHAVTFRLPHGAFSLKPLSLCLGARAYDWSVRACGQTCGAAVWFAVFVPRYFRFIFLLTIEHCANVRVSVVIFRLVCCFYNGLLWIWWWWLAVNILSAVRPFLLCEIERAALMWLLDAVSAKRELWSFNLRIQRDVITLDNKRWNNLLCKIQGIY